MVVGQDEDCQKVFLVFSIVMMFPFLHAGHFLLAAKFVTARTVAFCRLLLLLMLYVSSTTVSKSAIGVMLAFCLGVMRTFFWSYS